MATAEHVTIRGVGLAVALISAWAALGGCSSNDGRPPQLGDCLATDGGCTVVPGGGGGGSEDAGACGISPDDSLCTQCAGENCCSALDSCLADASCQNLLSCEEFCGGSSTCATTCQQQFASSLTLFDELESCLTVKCEVCSQAGVGDPCVPQETACNPGLVCGSAWCSKVCVRSADCVGLGAGGGNALGLHNACVATTGGDTCFPGCTSDSDCAEFPGTYCFATTELGGASVQVCTTFPDAGTD